MSFKETDLGFELKTDHYLVFFGKKDSSLENLKIAYPNFSFKMLWQVHGNDLLHSTSKSEENQRADAHWTEEKKLALISKSADCIPVLGFSKELNLVLAIHAGWRGVQNRIITKSLQSLGSSWDLFIGPHITKESFEIQNDCLELLKTCTRLDSKAWYDNQKADLTKIVFDQIKEVTTAQKPLTTMIFDTKTDSRFHSHRRDREAAGRQNSFIVLL